MVKKIILLKIGYIHRACVIDLKRSWDEHLLVVEFCYNNSYHSSIAISLLEAFCGRRCRLPIESFEVCDSSLLGRNMI